MFTQGGGVARSGEGSAFCKALKDRAGFARQKRRIILIQRENAVISGGKTEAKPARRVRFGKWLR